MQNVLKPVLRPQPCMAISSGPPGSSSGPPGSSSGPGGNSGSSCLGYTMWEFDGQQWQVKKVCAIQGAVTSGPPVIPGRFKGQLRTTACVAV
jgi:hypothetical protein